jgi:hypothetical protein
VGEDSWSGFRSAEVLDFGAPGGCIEFGGGLVAEPIAEAPAGLCGGAFLGAKEKFEVVEVFDCGWCDAKGVHNFMVAMLT